MITMKNTDKSTHTISYVFPIYYLKLYQVYVQWYHLLKKSTTWTVQKRQHYQNKQLQTLINHAYNNVPYFQQLLNQKFPHFG